MSQTKTIRSKGTKKSDSTNVETLEDPIEIEDGASIIKKIKKEVDLEDEEAVPAIDKPDDLNPFADGTSEDESSEEEAVLDDEEINPFGDKWEV